MAVSGSSSSTARCETKAELQLLSGTLEVRDVFSQWAGPG